MSIGPAVRSSLALLGNSKSGATDTASARLGARSRLGSLEQGMFITQRPTHRGVAPALLVVVAACGAESTEDAVESKDTAAQDTALVEDSPALLDVTKGACSAHKQCQRANPAPPCAVWFCDKDLGECRKKIDEDGVLCAHPDPCMAGAYCKAGLCVGQPKDCGDDGNDCTVVSCNPAKGQCETVTKKDGVGCDDGDKCTVGDSCASGTCSAGTNTCSCNTNADCKDPDANPCTGTYFCNKPSAEKSSWARRRRRHVE